MGRSASGKDMLAKTMASHGLTCLKTYTTRPCRGGADADAHVFIQESELTAYDDRCLEADFGGARYFARKTDVEAADLMVLEPTGVREVCGLFPDETFYVLDIVPADMDEADRRYMARFSEDHGPDEISAEKERLALRRRQESELFDGFEASLMVPNHPDTPPNVGRAYRLTNKYDPAEMEQTAKAFVAMWRQFNNVFIVACQMAAVGIFKTDPVTNKPILTFDATDGKPGSDRPVSVSHLTMALLNNDALFAQTVRQYLGCEFDEFPVPNELKYQAYKAVHKDE